MQTENAIKRQQPQQSVDALRIPEALLRVQTVATVTGYSRRSIYRGVADGTFPKPVKLSQRCVRWVAAEVSAWLRAQRGVA